MEQKTKNKEGYCIQISNALESQETKESTRKEEQDRKENRQEIEWMKMYSGAESEELKTRRELNV